MSSSRYRVVDWQGGRELMNTELNTLQAISHGVDSNGAPVVYDLDQLYRPGATQNVQVAISGLTATVSPIDATKPMAVFVRGRWETLLSSDVSSVTLSNTQTQIFLNYAVNIVTFDGSGGTLVDPSLVNQTGGAAANMGELDFTIGTTDTSAGALNATTQLEKNTSPIVLFQFTNSGSVLTQVVLDNANPQARGKIGVSGLVSTTTATPVVVSTDDPRLGLIGNAVVDASVRTPVASGGTNADGSAKYSIGTDPGGISAAKIIYQDATERLSDFLAWLKAQFNSLLATVNGHIGQALGSSNTHPFPTYDQVGAAPASHVGAPLGTGVHPTLLNSDIGGFMVNELGLYTPPFGSPATMAFGLEHKGTLVAGIEHGGGDYVCGILNSIVVNPGGTPITMTGSLESLLGLAMVVRDHVNQNSHANPHGLALSDLGGLSPTDFRYSTGNPGYIKFPAAMGGLAVQFGRLSSVASEPGYTGVSFAPGIFLSQCLSVVATTLGDIASSHDRITYIDPASISASGFNISNNGSGAGATWIAVGY